MKIWHFFLLMGLFFFFSGWYVNSNFIQLNIPHYLFGSLVSLMMSAIIGLQLINKKNYRSGKEHGTARWGRKKDIAPYVDPEPSNNIILTKTESLMMSGRPKEPKYARNKNILVVGGSGSGKTRFFVKPNLMQCDSKDYPVSFIVTDPKGTLAIETGNMLRRKGYKIKIFNTIDFSKSMKYNPFAYIKDEKDILKFVTTLITNTQGESKGGDDFWVKAETLLYQALIGFIIRELDVASHNMNTLVSMIGEMKTSEEDENFKNPIDIAFEDLASRDSAHFAVRQYAQYKLAAGKTAKSILISCAARLSPFNIKEVRDLVEYDEMELDKLGGFINRKGKVIKRKTALFIIISDTNASFNFLVSLMYSQLFNTLCEVADNKFNGRLPVHVRILADEFANIGKIPDFEKLIATIRSREISVSVILQTFSQLKAIYKDNMDTIIGNCDTKLFLGGSEKTTLEELSKMLGKETIDTVNSSLSRGKNGSNSNSHQKAGRELMTMDEIGVMDGEKCILQIRGTRPFLSDKYDLLKHANYKHLGDADDKNLMDIASFISTRNISKRTIKNKEVDAYHFA